VADILEASEMTGPWSVFTDAHSSEPPWTLAEHEKFVEVLRVYPQGLAAFMLAHSRATRWHEVEYESIAAHIGTKRWHEVKHYGLRCWRSEAYQQFLTRCMALVATSPSKPSAVIPRIDQSNGAVEGTGAATAEPFEDAVKAEPEPFPLPPTEDEPQQQVAQWRRIMLEWCIQTLSRYRPHRQEQAGTADVSSDPDLSSSLFYPLKQREILQGTFQAHSRSLRGQPVTRECGT
jgi:hypothetical protein